MHYKSMKCNVSFSLGSISTLFRWGGNFLSYMCETFLPPYNSAKIILKIDKDFLELLWSQMYCHLLSGSQYINSTFWSQSSLSQCVRSNRLFATYAESSTFFTCVSYAEARNRYRLDVCLSVRPSVRLSVRHTLVLYQNRWTYCHAFFATR